MRLQSRDSMWLAISHLIEERVGQLQGVADVRHWLLTIGAPFHLAVCWQHSLSQHTDPLVLDCA